MLLNTEIETAEGWLKGRQYREFLSWRGIPFAKPPMGQLRFRAPQPVAPWAGARDALRWGFAPPQMKLATMQGVGKYQAMSEDCLTLNVLVPAERSSKPRPVMVYIHGGGYLLGSSATMLYGGQSLVERGDIVYVSMNYRLGALGYVDFSQFSTRKRQFDSNLGLRDQIAALEWVKRNIAAFGGDPDNITIFGESAGGNSVTTLMCTPSAKGLFHKAIAQSANAGVCYGKERADKWARMFTEHLGVDTEYAVDALENASVHELGKAGLAFMKEALQKEPGTLGYAPVVDGDLLPMAPLDAFAAGASHKVPMIIGTNDREGALFKRFGDQGMPLTVDAITKMFANTQPELFSSVIAGYSRYPDKRVLEDICGDVMFWKPSIDCAAGHSAVAPTYSYRFDFSTRLLDAAGLGATHAMELVPVFGLTDTAFGKMFTRLGGQRAMRGLSHRMQSHWLGFARDGKPMSTWPQYNTHDRLTMIFKDHDTVVKDPRAHRRLAWEGFRGYL